MKKPAGVFAGGLVVLFDLSGRLAQAIAVRRHDGPVVMVVTVMAVDLHLHSSYGKSRGNVNSFLSLGTG